VSSSLRAFDSVWFENVEGACDGVAIGHPVEPTCAGATAVVLPLRIPSGTVALEEGGEAGADAVRVSVATTADGYEEVSVRGTISVPDDSDVRIPAFSAEPGTAIEVPLGEPG